MDDLITLVGKTYTKDSIGQYIETETQRSVYATITSVSGSEWTNAGTQGIKADRRVKLFYDEYQGEDEVIIDNVHFAVYRTYRQGDFVELYLEKKVGV